ncbi:MAG: 8-oxo-dGTP pyrophosphatase MutT (NUDIX family) [Halioglobus sp.]|jgi:8-oxo-dGTP pyrophosphatase MutT (NUDIX family)
MKALNNHNFTNATREQISSNICGFKDTRQDQGGLRRAAVTLTVFNHDGEAAVIITQRAESLRAHGGQWALPGGRIDAGESSVQAALRELREEVNLPLDETHVLGKLDDYVTRSGYIITPVVLWSDVTASALTPNAGEVASIHPFTFSELSRADSPHLESIPESERQVLSMNFGDMRIYAPTAAMLYQFREVAILGKHTPVLHYDQPVFAWS